MSKVSASSGSGPAVVELAGGGSISASKGVVVAVEGPEAARLLGQSLQVGIELQNERVGAPNRSVGNARLGGCKQGGNMGGGGGCGGT